MSKLPEAIVFPSGLKATDSIRALCLTIVWIELPALTSQSLIVLSALSEASAFPSGLKATNATEPPGSFYLIAAHLPPTA